MKPIYGSTFPRASNFLSLVESRSRYQITQSTSLEQERDQKKRRALGTTELENAQRCSPLRIHCAYLGGSFVCSLFRGIVVPLLDLCASTKVRKTSFGHMKLQQIGIYRYCLLETRKSCLIQGCSQPIINLQDVWCTNFWFDHSTACNKPVMRYSGELKRLRPSSVGEVNAYLSCVQFSGDVKRKGNQNNQSKSWVRPCDS